MDQNKVERRLSAIFYADIVGYSRLTEQDEVATHHKLLAYMDWIAKTINDHGGAVIKFAGDAVLAEFRSAVDALSCAAAIQKNPAEAQSHEADADTLKLRIGLNVGDIIAARDDIYGDGVNVAARLESLASAGGICISHSVLEQVRNKLEFGYEALGEQSVKNISEPVRAYRVILDPETAGEIKDAPKRAGRPAVRTAVLAMILLVGVLSTALWMIYPRYLSQTADEKSAQGEEYVSTSPSIAVLPFRNISGNAEEDYFSDGITQDITTDLSKFRALFVISSSAVLPFKGQSIPAQDVSEKLGVRYVPERQHCNRRAC